jgi:hypothetical protein
VLGIARKGLERLARCGEEQIVEEAGSPEGQAVELVGQREATWKGDGEVGAPGSTGLWASWHGQWRLRQES